MFPRVVCLCVHTYTHMHVSLCLCLWVSVCLPVYRPHVVQNVEGVSLSVALDDNVLSVRVHPLLQHCTPHAVTHTHTHTHMHAYQAFANVFGVEGGSKCFRGGGLKPSMTLFFSSVLRPARAGTRVMNSSYTFRFRMNELCSRDRQHVTLTLSLTT
eukprot:2320581-Rhodomonas_salina.1